ncbi:hypothetical protein GCM10010129_67500 [Streptomyces fumigatiscleroticus]|nr:hypothetical protein GCM10010129_67500 [Streptomyces fumigatiscleroticus]
MDGVLDAALACPTGDDRSAVRHESVAVTILLPPSPVAAPARDGAADSGRMRDNRAAGQGSSDGSNVQFPIDVLGASEAACTDPRRARLDATGGGVMDKQT